jgi:hypothetical protein
MSMDEENRVRLTVRALRVARELDPEALFLVTLGQPWAEYMARREHQYSPLHFADALIRADLGLGAVGLEVAMGYDKDASYCRDHLELSELIDRYSLLGVPIHVSLAVPSGTDHDPKAWPEWKLGGGSWHNAWSEQVQADWLARTLHVVGCKPMVQEACLSHFSDSVEHEFPLSGLLRFDGTPKPALQRIGEFRSEHLK